MGNILSPLSITIGLGILTGLDADLIIISSVWTSGNITCSISDQNCTISCIDAYSCGVENGPQFAGPQIHCPTISSCFECNINCLEDQSCSGATIYGYDCSNLNINVEHKDNKAVTIYAPDDGGSLNIVLLTSDAKLKDSFIYAGIGTNNITIDCSSGKEFKTNEVNASTISGTLSFVSEGDCKSDDSLFICPEDSHCLIECNGGSCKNMKMVAEFGTHNLDFICGSGVDCTDTVLSCNYDSKNITDCSMTGCNGPCVLPPTSQPTFIPTIFPTEYPTNFPTEYPTIFPTEYPTIFPTEYPTIFPTEYPTIFPTEYPTIFPTENPTDFPTEYPTDFPTNNTADPSVDPTIHPTIHPTYHPLSIEYDLRSGMENNSELVLIITLFIALISFLVLVIAILVLIIYLCWSKNNSQQNNLPAQKSSMPKSVKSSSLPLPSVEGPSIDALPSTCNTAVIVSALNISVEQFFDPLNEAVQITPLGDDKIGFFHKAISSDTIALDIIDERRIIHSVHMQNYSSEIEVEENKNNNVSEVDTKHDLKNLKFLTINTNSVSMAVDSPEVQMDSVDFMLPEVKIISPTLSPQSILDVNESTEDDSLQLSDSDSNKSSTNEDDLEILFEPIDDGNETQHNENVTYGDDIIILHVSEFGIENKEIEGE